MAARSEAVDMRRFGRGVPIAPERRLQVLDNDEEHVGAVDAGTRAREGQGKKEGKRSVPHHL